MTTTTMFRSFSLLALPLVLAACGKTDGAATTSTDDAGASADATPVGPPGNGVVRTIEERSPFGNLSVPDNLVLDGDFEFTGRNGQTMGNLVKVFGWYDNEWGYSNRLAELVALTGGKVGGRKPRAAKKA